MPAVATTNRIGADYLRDQPPTTTPFWSAAPGGLSIFVAVVVLRLCIRRFQRKRNSRTPSKVRPQAPSLVAAPRHLQHTCPHQQPHAAPSGTMSEKESDDQRPLVPGPPRRNTGGPGAEDGMLRQLITRPPPAPPLTPPELSSTVFAFANRPHSPSHDSLIHQPNPDYISLSASGAGSPPDATAASAQPMRLSYSRTIPIGVPITRQSSASESDTYFSPSSYPPSSPLLPPAPPTDMAAHLDTDEPSPARARDIELRGEIVGVLDGQGVGWTRHTRVYGGGPCMACAAAGRAHGDGGFYGPNVMPEEMR
ncbi:uncharacterized protein F5Z01DRAFT_552096 [Emericellopsis atlantica]|uniref:Uncharacterized protein n=1 Tax=Emericellopsis atlantica TaxID=2614577 RepID=A0A9P8CR02_9HYPO|nr:uncharacterized protein F5Z01DRAFT_552096 [Emericellopsis atlantica]KAG9255675.1 hypothetical protein F5Z01DRAFT_552096 [Emericellopsis atlantica]